MPDITTTRSLVLCAGVEETSMLAEQECGSSLPSPPLWRLTGLGRHTRPSSPCSNSAISLEMSSWWSRAGGRDPANPLPPAREFGAGKMPNAQSKRLLGLNPPPEHLRPQNLPCIGSVGPGSAGRNALCVSGPSKAPNARAEDHQCRASRMFHSSSEPPLPSQPRAALWAFRPCPAIPGAPRPASVFPSGGPLRAMGQC